MLSAKAKGGGAHKGGRGRRQHEQDEAQEEEKKQEMLLRGSWWPSHHRDWLNRLLAAARLRAPSCEVEELLTCVVSASLSSVQADEPSK